MAILPVGIGSAEGGDFQIERSLRFNSADSAYLNRTFGAGNQKTWTLSAWVKRSALGDNQIFSNYTNGSDVAWIYFNSLNELYFQNYEGSNQLELKTTQVFRDVGAWGHLVVNLDTTQATSSNRAKLYWNGVQITTLTTATYPSQNADLKINTNTEVHELGRASTTYFNGYLTEINFIDGSALDPTSFGEFNSETGVWQPKAYTGSYGTNGFYLDFADNSSVAALGYDAAGSNDWSVNGISVTAGADNDSLVDTPTNYGTDTGVGGEVRGNYCTWNGVGLGGGTLSNGNLDGSFTIQTGRQGTFTLDNGSWYWETTVTTIGVSDFLLGIISSSATSGVITGGAAGINVFYQGNGNVRIDNSVVTTVATYTSGDVIGIAYNGSTRSLSFYKNNSLQTTQTATANYSYVPWVCTPASGTSVISTNFGQRPFAHTAPSGFKALVTTNLPEPTIADGGEYFNTVLYTGNGSTQSITGVGFQPDWVWTKGRSNADNNSVFDVLRGVGEELVTNGTGAEAFDANLLTSFDADGFSVGSNSGINGSAKTYVAWNWKANGAGVSNTDGTITSTVSANTDSGFSIVTYTGTGSAATVGHGLGVAPKMFIIKGRSVATGWIVYHAFDNASPATGYMALQTTDAFFTSPAFNDTAPTSTVFSINGTGYAVNNSGETYVAYCFAAVPGYSAFGSYTGNGSADGPFVYTGFRPRYYILKNITNAQSWSVQDTARSPYNVGSAVLLPNSSSAELTGTDFVDILSNGFKIRHSSSGNNNNNGDTYIFMAFAESPFKIALAR